MLGQTGKGTTLAERRSSLKGMRQFLSLPPTSGNMLSRLIQSKVRLPSYMGKNVDLKRELHAINERDFFFEIVKDISHDLDPKSLTNRILVNVCILLDADRSSLFFVEGDKDNRSLVSKVFDIYTGTDCIPTRSGDNIVRIPWGQGILGHVAESGETVNITQASQDPRYNDDLDRMVGYSTDSLLSMPIRSADGDIIGVVQVINKNTVEGYFEKDDEKVLETYLAFCGMAISTAQAIEAYSREYDRNKALLEVVHDLFEEQTSVDHVVTTIMQRAQSLLKCERCVVMLKEDKGNPAHETSAFSRLFDIQNALQNGQKNIGTRNGKPSLSPPSQIAEIVAKTGETVNISDGHANQMFMFPDGLSSDTHLQTKSILCKPIRNNKLHTIGVAQLINRLDGKPFDQNDDELFEAFTIFCGLGINNCLLYDQMSRSSATQAVALEVLSYHAHVPGKDVATFMAISSPNMAAWRLDRLDFNDYLLNTDEMVMAAIHMFEEADLLKTFKIEYQTLVQWLLTVRKNYRNIAYHNWRHAFNVCQFMFVLLTTCGLKKYLTDVECLALIVACLCHDLDHRGTNNAFQLKSGSPLMQLYGTEATLEHHHFNHAVMILNSEGHNIFGNLSSAEYTKLMPLLKHAILATDIPLHMQKRGKFFSLVDDGNCDWGEQEHKMLLRSILMTTCDIATITKPWEVQRKAASLVVAEFFSQGDQERTVLNIEPQEQMDREREDQLPKLQMKWIDGVCLPLYSKFAQLDRQLRPLVANVLDNRENWRRLDEGETEKNSFKETGV